MMDGSTDHPILDICRGGTIVDPQCPSQAPSQLREGTWFVCFFLSSLQTKSLTPFRIVHARFAFYGE